MAANQPPPPILVKTPRSFFAPLLVVSILGISQVMATVTLQFSLAGTGRATGFSNSAGLVGVDGMRWGLIIDTTGNGISAGSYDGGFNINASGFLTTNNGLVTTDDYYVAHPLQTTTSTSTSTGGDPGGAGTITAIAGVPFDAIGDIGLGTGISTGDPFSLIWFESGAANGNKYGVLSNQSLTPQFDIPSNSSTTSYASFFAGGTADPIKAASFTFGAVPEPSISLLGVFGVGIIVMRRRRK